MALYSRTAPRKGPSAEKRTKPAPRATPPSAPAVARRAPAPCARTRSPRSSPLSTLPYSCRSPLSTAFNIHLSYTLREVVGFRAVRRRLFVRRAGRGLATSGVLGSSTGHLEEVFW